MDCREFRKQHLAYLDDTLPGDDMAAAQRHIMACDACAAHDTMVRRSLMLVRNMAVIEPSADFRERMQARLKETRAEMQRERFRQQEFAPVESRSPLRQPVVISAVAASVLIMGTMVWRQVTPREESVAVAQPAPVAAKPVIDTTLTPIYLTPEMVQAMATGNPMWPAAILVDDTPAQLMNSELTAVKAVRE